MKFLLNTLLLSVVLCAACKKERGDVLPPDGVEIATNLTDMLTGQHQLSSISYAYNITGNRTGQGFAEVFPISLTVLSPKTLRLEMTLDKIEINEQLEVTRSYYHLESEITALHFVGDNGNFLVELTYSIQDNKPIFRVLHYHRRFAVRGEYIYVSNLPIS